VLPIATATHHEPEAAQREPTSRSASAQRDAELEVQIRSVWRRTSRFAAPGRSGAKLNREGIRVARCRVARLMKKMELEGTIRGGGL
jgi:putative transposase